MSSKRRPELMALAQAARFLGTDLRTLQQAIRLKKVAAVLWNERYFLRRGDLERARYQPPR